jgi:hypothetical protein
MPIDESTSSNTAGQNTNASITPPSITPPTNSVSDLGELLIDKSLENIQNKDFVPVSKNDIVNFLGSDDNSTTDDSANINNSAIANNAITDDVTSNSTIDNNNNAIADNTIADNTTTDDATTDSAIDNNSAPFEEPNVGSTSIEISPTAADVDVAVDVASDINADTIDNVSLDTTTDSVEKVVTETTSTSFDPLNILGTPGVTANTNDVEEISNIQSSDAKDVNDIDTISDTISDTVIDTVSDIPNNTATIEIDTQQLKNIPMIEESTDIEHTTTSSSDPFASINLDQTTQALDQTTQTIVDSQTSNSIENTTPTIDLPVIDSTNTLPVENVKNTEELISDTSTSIADDMNSIILDEPEKNEIESIANAENTLEKTIPVVIENPSLDTIQIPDTSSLIDIPSIDNTNTTINNTTPISNALSNLQETISTHNVSSTENNTPWTQTVIDWQINNSIETTPSINNINSTEKSNLEAIANDITQGIDLDSLLPDTNSSTPINTASIVNPEPTVATATTDAHHDISAEAQKKKKMLLILWSVAFLWLVFFAIQLMNGWSSSNTTTNTPAVEATTGDVNDNETPPSDDIITDTPPSDDSSINSGDETDWNITPPNEGNTDEDITTLSGSSDVTPPVNSTPTVTQEGLLSEGQTLMWKVKKALMQATLKKNWPIRLSAFELQKDLQAFVQTLENTSDISNLEESASTLTDLSKRLDWILQKLDGSSQ